MAGLPVDSVRDTMNEPVAPANPAAGERGGAGALTRRDWFILLGALAAVLGYRLWLIHASQMQLFFDEAYYLGWSRDIALGYFSKPPLLAWSLAIVTGICGTSELCIKSSSLVWYALAAVFLALSATRLYGRSAGILSGVVFYTMPAVALLSLAVSTDGPLLAFWCLGLWLFVEALSGRRGAWAGVGVAVGLGMLSKYTMAVFPVCMLLCLATRDERRWLRTPGPWLAIAIGLAIVSPNLVWNLTHGSPSLTHTAEIASWSGERAHWSDLGAFLGAQFGVFGLLAFPLALAFALMPGLWAERGARIAATFFLPLLAIYAAQAWLGGANANWALAAYASATVLIVGQLLLRGSRGRALLAAVIVANVALGGLVYHWQSLAPLAGVELGRRTDPWARVMGWRELGAELAPIRARFPDAELLGDSRSVIAEMDYYAGPWPGVAAWNPDGSVTHQYELTADLREREAPRYLYVGETDFETLAQSFAAAERLGPIRARVYDDLVREYQVYLLTGFEGYDREGAQ